MSARIEHQIAGLAHEGKYDRPLEAAGWPVAGVALDGETLHWALRGSAPDRRGEADSGMLDGFLKLSSAPTDKIVAFAEKYGPLSAANDWPVFEGAEPIEWWRTLSSEANAVLDVAAAILGESSVAEHWDRFTTVSVEPYDDTDDGLWSWTFEDYGPLRATPGIDGGGAERIASQYVDRWLGDVRVDLLWTPFRAAAMHLVPGGLLGALGLQLAQNLARHEGGLALMCRACGRSFAPRTGQRRYCQECRDRNEPQRLATKRSRERARARMRQQDG